MGNAIYWVNLDEDIPIDTNAWVFVALEIFTLLTTAFNIFGVYVVAFHSPPNMRTYGKVLTVYQTVALITDLMIGSALAPYVTFPLPGGFPMGWLAGVVSTFYQFSYPKLKHFIWHPLFYAMMRDNATWLTKHIGAWIVMAVSWISVACLSCWHVFESRKDTISPKTLRMYRRLVAKVTLQVCIPLVTILIPLLACMVIFYTDNFASITLMPFGLALFSQHAVLSTCMTFFLYRPYTGFALRMAWKILSKIYPSLAPRIFNISDNTTIAPVHVASASRRFTIAVSVVVRNSSFDLRMK
ncbi:unnamed protein product, partial [Mesorhabditis belari]|uniref:Uncharacterized protein n=1 Tax=Mesorhabditis belari TaxID=2138241 RepID=A0AAF3FL63_9BILA